MGDNSTPTPAPASYTAVFNDGSSRRMVAPFDSTPDTYTLDGKIYKYAGTSDGVAFYVTLPPVLSRDEVRRYLFNVPPLDQDDYNGTPV